MQLTILASPFFSAFLYAIHPFYCLFPTNPQPQSILLNNAALPVPELTLCLSLCRMISTGRSRGRTRPCLTRWWYSSARWSVSCSHGGYSDCWHWNERGGTNQERKGGKERQNVVSITDVERVRKGAGEKKPSSSVNHAEEIRRESKNCCSWI